MLVVGLLGHRLAHDQLLSRPLLARVAMDESVRADRCATRNASRTLADPLLPMIPRSALRICRPLNSYHIRLKRHSISAAAVLTDLFIPISGKDHPMAKVCRLIVLLALPTLFT